MADIRCPLREAGETSKHEEALAGPEGQLTYYEFDQLVSATAARLADAGCRAGDRVGILAELDWRYPTLALALLRAGAIACPLNPEWPDAFLAAAVALLKPRAVVASPSLLPCLAGSRAQVWKADEVAVLGVLGGDAALDERIPHDRPATLVFPFSPGCAARGVLQTYGNHYYGARGANANIRVRSRDRWLLWEPLWRAEGLAAIFRCVISGATLVVPDLRRALDTELADRGITHVSMDADSLRVLVESGRDMTKLTALRTVVVGGAVESALVEQAFAKHVPLYLSYGLSEMASQVTAVQPDSPPEKRRTSGRVLKYRNLRLADDGEILVKGETLFAGYVDGDGVRPALDAEGWFATGDLGRMDADGYLTVTGRKKG